MTDRPAVHVDHGRTEEQREVMRQIIEDGVDPFDWDNLAKYHKQPVLKKGEFWLITANDSPYHGSMAHFLLIYRDRGVTIGGMCPRAWTELRNMIAWIQADQNLSHGAILMRFGDIALSGASVDHPHMHIIVGGNDPTAEKLKAAVGYKQQ